MNHAFHPNPRDASLHRRFAWALIAAFASLSPAFAAPPGSTSIQVVSDPLTVSVSRVGGPTFFVEYTVAVTNNSSNNNFTYDFKGTTAVYDDKGKPVPGSVAEFVSSSGLPCQAISATEITCAQLPVDKNSSKTFKVVFKSPVSGARLRFTVKSTSNAIKGEGYADTTLITIPYEQTITSFYTFVPKEGGIFYTGVNGNLAGSPGSVATFADPWATTVVVPPINFTTTARANELQNGELPSCSPSYQAGGCFSTNLEIPSAPGAFQSLIIYLRIDASKINQIGSSISTAVIRYAKDGLNFTDVLDCTAANGLPQPGSPCISNRKAYPYSGVPIQWQLDWEFEIRAVDNGRYIN